MTVSRLDDPWQPLLDALAADGLAWAELPSTRDSPPSEVLAAIEAFDAGGAGGGIAATRWLHEEAVGSYATSRTWLALASGQVVGYYSLASAQVALRQRDRRKLGLTIRTVSVPATLVTWIARSRAGGLSGQELLLHAIGTARRATAFQASAVLVVDAFDRETARMWRERYGFRTSADAAEDRRLWLPLQVD